MVIVCTQQIQYCSGSFFKKDKVEIRGKMNNCALIGMNIYFCNCRKFLYWLCGSIIYFSILNVWLVKFCVHYSQQYRVCHQPGPEKYYTPLQPGPSPGHLLTTLFARTLISIFFTTDYSPVFRKVNVMSLAEACIQVPCGMCT